MLPLSFVDEKNHVEEQANFPQDIAAVHLNQVVTAPSGTKFLIKAIIPQLNEFQKAISIRLDCLKLA